MLCCAGVQDVASAACPLPCDDKALPEGTFPSLFCVFDGHCGRGAAEEANNLLPDELAARLPGGKLLSIFLGGGGGALPQSLPSAISRVDGCYFSMVVC